MALQCIKLWYLPGPLVSEPCMPQEERRCGENLQAQRCAYALATAHALLQPDGLRTGVSIFLEFSPCHAPPAALPAADPKPRSPSCSCRRAPFPGCTSHYGNKLSICSAETEVHVPLAKAWELWEDRERIPNWMPWLASVTVLPEDSKMSRWLLSTHQFGRDWEFSWLAQNLTPIKNQKVCCRSDTDRVSDCECLEYGCSRHKPDILHQHAAEREPCCTRIQF